MTTRALLLNPPASDLVIRDYYCSKTTKSNYIYSPVDLLLQSGWLSRRGDVAVIDAVVDRLGEAECLRRAAALKPGAVVFLTGAVSWERDFRFLARLKEALGGAAPFIGSGDIFQEEGRRWLEEFPFIDAALLDFTNEDACRYLEGRDEEIESAVFRRRGAIRVARRERPRGALFEVPRPRHELFANPAYRFSFVRRRPFATVLTDFGCPFPCRFCVMGSLASKARTVENVLEELRALAGRGIKEVFFIDQTWGLHRERNLEICARLESERLDLGWVAYSRVDVVDAEVLAAWRRAGCHTLMFGVEFGDDALLRTYAKGYGRAQIDRGLALAREAGIRTVGTFILGVPEDTAESVEATIRLARELPLDFASFNVAVPRHATALRAQAKGEGLIGDLRTMDQSGATVAMPTRSLTREQVAAYRRKAILSFYLRPPYLWRRAREAMSWFELRSQVAEGLALLRRAAF